MDELERGSGIEKELYAAIESGNIQAVQRIFMSNPGLCNRVTSLGTCLHTAAELGQLDIVKFLVTSGADINAEADVGGTPLDLAAANGHLEVVKYLLEMGVSVDVPCPERNPLFSAIYEGQVECARYLLQAGMDPHVLYKSETGRLKNALSYAKELGRAEIVEMLVKAGCRLPKDSVHEPSLPEALHVPARATTDTDHDEITSRISDVFGPADQLALQEIVPVHDEVHVAIGVTRPNEKSPFLTLFTTGMSDRPMNCPQGQDKYQYAELLMHLPATWPIPRSHKVNSEWIWPFEWLRKIAYYPHLHNSWLGGAMTIIPSADPPVPLGPNTEQSCLLLLADFADWSPIVLKNRKTVHFYTVIPIYSEERDFETQHGIVALLERLHKHKYTAAVSVNRASVVPA
jgi:hypothetical protein